MSDLELPRGIGIASLRLLSRMIHEDGIKGLSRPNLMPRLISKNLARYDKERDCYIVTEEARELLKGHQ